MTCVVPAKSLLVHLFLVRFLASPAEGSVAPGIAAPHVNIGRSALNTKCFAALPRHNSREKTTTQEPKPFLGGWLALPWLYRSPVCVCFCWMSLILLNDVGFKLASCTILKGLYCCSRTRTRLISSWKGIFLGGAIYLASYWKPYWFSVIPSSLIKAYLVISHHVEEL